jgi:hypothetical protein
MSGSQSKRPSLNDIREQNARIEQMQADIDMKRQSMRFARWQLAVALMLATASLLASGAAFMKLVLDVPVHAAPLHFSSPDFRFVL